MDFSMAMNYIDEKNKLGIVPGLDGIYELLRRLDNPQDKVKCLHIAGTNGKGSIFSFMENILLEEGYKVGRYISPTIFTYLERFQINQEIIAEDDFTRLISKIAACVKEMEADGFMSPTAFEIETALTFLYFYENNVDYALIECGMGGELDATNVIKKPVASVMASISMDHMQFLGDTIEKIAKTKAGIIKSDSMLVSYPQEESVCSVLKSECENKTATYACVNIDDVTILSQALEQTEFLYKQEKYAIRLIGDYQIYNAATAILLCEKLNEKASGTMIKTESIKRGLMKTYWPGRMSKIHEKPLIYVDGAHNEKAWLELYTAVNKYFTNKQIIYIIGVLRDKEYTKMVDILAPTMKEAITVTPANKRGLEKECLAKLISEHGVPAVTACDCEDALTVAMGKASSDDVILVCGSLSFISEYLVYFDK